MSDAVSVSPSSTGILAAITWLGVIWYLPPNGIHTVPLPIVASGRSAKPF